jgi:hypothetical protein
MLYDAFTPFVILTVLFEVYGMHVMLGEICTWAQRPESSQTSAPCSLAVQSIASRPGTAEFDQPQFCDHLNIIKNVMKTLEITV